MKTFNCVNQAYLSSLEDLLKHGTRVKSVSDPTSIGSQFGDRKRDFIEIRGYNFTLTNPRNRLIFSNERKPSLGFSIANFFWFLSGRKDVKPITFYNKLGEVFSKDGVYYEAAFGNRIFGEYHLCEYALNLLKGDSSSRRSFIPIFFPGDLKNLPLDTPCASSIQIMKREGKVEFFLHMRSQSLAMVFPYDIFLFTMLHEFLSQLLDMPIGNFHYYCNSFHYYVEEELLVKRILQLDNQSQAVCMPSMPQTSWEDIQRILEFEESLRNAIIKKESIPNLSSLEIDEYWKSLLKISILKGFKDHNIKFDSSESIYLSSDNLFI